jgi:hypothetical protein
MHTLATLLVLLTVVASTQAQGAVEASEAARLGGPELTPIGAERRGNAEGSIPAWTGGITALPDGYVKGQHEADPFAEDEPLFTITAENMDEHAAHLSTGQKALLAAHPDTWRMPIYASRRSASYPSFVYDAIRRNAQTAELVTTGKQGVVNATVSSPFPIPANGLEVIWNHSLRWRGIRVSRAEGTAAVTRRGRFRVILAEQDFAFPYGMPDTGVGSRYHNLLLVVKAKVIEPALLAGDGSLVVEPINQTDEQRKSWQYSRALSHVVRLPYFGYELPAPNTDALRTVDDFGLYNGPTDRFEWELVGKREIYIPYNAYQIHTAGRGYTAIVHKRHINPELARYELHRVWVVEARLKSGQRHVYSRRTFYLDEDTWQIALSDSYDLSGALWRTAEAHALSFYTVPMVWATLEVFYDLAEGRYLVNGLDNKRHAWVFADDFDPREFSPNALNYYVR